MNGLHFYLGELWSHWVKKSFFFKKSAIGKMALTSQTRLGFFSFVLRNDPQKKEVRPDHKSLIVLMFLNGILDQKITATKRYPFDPPGRASPAAFMENSCRRKTQRPPLPRSN